MTQSPSGRFLIRRFIVTVAALSALLSSVQPAHAGKPSTVRQQLQRTDPCLVAIIDRENRRWDPTLDFGGGHGNVYESYGLPQANPGTKMASAGPDWRTNPWTQIRWAQGYARGRYGSTCAAWAFWRAHGFW